MKIKYKFVDGTMAEIEVEDSIGTVIKESRHLEGNLERKMSGLPSRMERKSKCKSPEADTPTEDFS